MLTGKAKIHFEVWAKQHPDMNYRADSGVLQVGNAFFPEWPNCVRQAFVLEWLDSVEIYVSVIPVVRAAEYFFFSEVTYRWYRGIETWSSRRFTTRESATEAAIKQAIAICNGKGG